MLVECPNCKNPVWIEAINCGIFRHGAYRHNHEQIHPHASESDCKKLIFEGQIYGCGMPFRVVTNTQGEVTVQICDYL